MSEFVDNIIKEATENNQKGVNKYLCNVSWLPIDNPDRPRELYSATFEFAVPVAKKEIYEQVSTEIRINNTIEEVVQTLLIRSLELFPNLLVPSHYLKRFTEEMGAIVHRIVTNDPIYQPYFYTREEFNKLVEQDPRGSHTKMMVRLNFLISVETTMRQGQPSGSRPYFTVSGKTHEVIKKNGYIQMGKIIEQVSITDKS